MIRRIKTKIGAIVKAGCHENVQKFWHRHMRKNPKFSKLKALKKELKCLQKASREGLELCEKTYLLAINSLSLAFFVALNLFIVACVSRIWVLLRFVIHKIAQVRAFKIKGKEPAIETASNEDDLGEPVSRQTFQLKEEEAASVRKRKISKRIAKLKRKKIFGEIVFQTWIEKKKLFYRAPRKGKRHRVQRVCLEATRTNETT
ncbi:uncharacterized protein [Oscarella lobularis]|uniref:uncharacterized protein n=1 Tax=Oscarella lobularis TaxID=121494 RepID=UPI00331386FB